MDRRIITCCDNVNSDVCFPCTSMGLLARNPRTVDRYLISESMLQGLSVNDSKDRTHWHCSTGSTELMCVHRSIGIVSHSFISKLQII